MVAVEPRGEDGHHGKQGEGHEVRLTETGDDVGGGEKGPCRGAPVYRSFSQSLQHSEAHEIVDADNNDEHKREDVETIHRR